MQHYTSPSDRKRFYERHEAGQSYEKIADSFGVSKECVRMWCRRQREGGNTEDRYYNPRAGILSQFPTQVKEAIVRLREQHARWGPESIRIHLGAESGLAEAQLPSRASIGRYLHSFERYRHTPKKKVS